MAITVTVNEEPTFVTVNETNTNVTVNQTDNPITVQTSLALVTGVLASAAEITADAQVFWRWYASSSYQPSCRPIF